MTEEKKKTAMTDEEKKTAMTDEEKKTTVTEEKSKDEADMSMEELSEKLDADLNEFIAAEAAKYPKAETKDTEKDRWDKQLEEMMRHPAFLTEIDYSKPLDPGVEALMQLKYEDENPTARAQVYKEDGNVEFKKKKYDIAIENYTEGIQCKCVNKELNAILYSNRAAAQYYKKNYRSALRDCVFARKFKPSHAKAIIKGAQCCMEMKRYDEVDRWCNAALLIDPKDEKMLELKLKADKLKRTQERDRRKEEAKERKELAENMKLLNEIQSRGIQLAGLKISDNKSKVHPGLLVNLDLPDAVNAKVHLDSDNGLVWPVLFLYPEHTQTDFIQGFHQNHRFEEHIEQMFGPKVERPSWDTDKKYTPDGLQIYFEDKEKEALYEVSKHSTLLQSLQHKRHFVQSGTPCFVLLVRDSMFQESYLQRYKVYPLK